jgi:hypothetical protein
MLHLTRHYLAFNANQAHSTQSVVHQVVICVFQEPIITTATLPPVHLADQGFLLQCQEAWYVCNVKKAILVTNQAAVNAFHVKLDHTIQSNPSLHVSFVLKERLQIHPIAHTAYLAKQAPLVQKLEMIFHVTHVKRELLKLGLV